MKNSIKKILCLVGRILSVVCHRKLVSVYSGMLDNIYTGYVRGGFRHFGDSVCMWRFTQLIGEEYIQIGDNCIIEPNVQMAVRKVSEEHSPILKIGNGCLIRKDSHITAVKSIIIGDGLLTGTNVIITDNSHGDTDRGSLMQPPRLRNVISKGSVVIGDNVWLGNNVCVLSGVTIGDGAVIGANSVVTHDIPAYSVAAGIPAKVIK